MSINSTILHMLITARLLHVASPEYRQKKAAKKARKAAEKAEMNELLLKKPLAATSLILSSVCVLGIPFFLFYPGVSAWWSLASFGAAIMFFILSLIAGSEWH